MIIFGGYNEILHEAGHVHRADATGSRRVERGDILDLLFLIITAEFSFDIAMDANADKDRAVPEGVSGYHTLFTNTTDDDICILDYLFGIRCLGMDDRRFAYFHREQMCYRFSGSISPTDDGNALVPKPIRKVLTDRARPCQSVGLFKYGENRSGHRHRKG